MKRQIVKKLIKFHKEQNCEATLSAVQPTGRFGALEVEKNRVTKFLEKPRGDGQWVNGGFMVCEPSIIDRISNNETIFEQRPLISLAEEKKLAVLKHNGFWAAMDTLRDKKYLDDLWERKEAPWKVWP